MTGGRGISDPTHRFDDTAVAALLVGLTVFGVLWLLNIPYRQAYQPDQNDVTALADGLLLTPGARWEDWFTQGHKHFFDAYPEWPVNETAFARPAFQFLIYLAHFVLGRDWSAYLAINYLGVAGIAAVAWAIARTALGLSVGAALLAAALVLLSPAVLELSIWQVGFASESVASVLIGCVFLAVVARRDLICVGLLMVALLTKETAVWAPFAAGLTVLLRSDPDTALRRRAAVAAVMLLPMVFWLAFRFAFFGGIGGTYATASYWPLTSFLQLTFSKLTHLHRLFVAQDALMTDGAWAYVDRAIRVGTALLLFLLLLQWTLSSVRQILAWLGKAGREGRWPTVGAPLLVTLWGVLGLAFYFILALGVWRYAAAAMMFVWPAVVSEVVRRRAPLFRLALAACLVLPMARTSHLLLSFNPPSEESFAGWFFRSLARMNAALRQTPGDIQQVYVVPAGGMVPANSEYIRGLLGMRAEIVRVIDIAWACERPTDHVVVSHESADGVVTLVLAVPDCAGFYFIAPPVDIEAGISGRLRRSSSITYELPEATWTQNKEPGESRLELGRRMIVRVRPSGPARFIIEQGGQDGGIAWFDTP